MERVRRYALGEQDRSDWQLSLSDTDRSPEHVAQTPPKEGEPKPALKLPDLRDYPAGYHRYSLVEVSPGEGFSSVKCLADAGVLGFEARAGGKLYRVSFDRANCRTMLQVR